MKSKILKLAAYKPAYNIICILLFMPVGIYAQESVDLAPKKLSIGDVITLGKANNKFLRGIQAEAEASNLDLRDAKVNALPTVAMTSSYQRFTKLTLYESGLGGAHSVPKLPSQNGADANISANFNLYTGGRQAALVEEQLFRKQLASLNKIEQTANIGLQAAGQYLDMIRLTDQRNFLLDQVRRAETRLKNIQSLYRNQKVTRSDLLRAELNLSAVKLSLQQAENDILISNQKLNVLIDLPNTAKIIPTDSASIPLPTLGDIEPLVGTASTNAFAIRKSDENIHIQNARIKNLRSNYRPSVALYSGYGISYPNTIFFPPVDQAYSIGFIGLKIQYNLSSIYHNKNKVAAGKVRLKELEYFQQNIADNVNQDAQSLLIKYQEALNRITVNEKSIEQATVNYKIVNAKYLNQLALLTDLLDADNLYQESRYNLVLAQTNARLIYYRLLYISGTF